MIVMNLLNQFGGGFGKCRPHSESDSSFCGHCKDTPETTMHILRDCPLAVSIWNDLLPSARRQGFFSQELKGWMDSNLCRSESWATTFSFAVWWLWKWRNERVFGSNSGTAQPLFRFILDRAEEFLSLSSSRGRNHGGPSLVSWERPKVGWVKLNCDGSFCTRNSKIVAGGLLRDADGEFIRGFVAQEYGRSAFHAELIGLGHGLEMAKALHVDNLWVEVDSKEVLELVTAALHRDYILKIRNYINDPRWRVIFTHVPR